MQSSYWVLRSSYWVLRTSYWVMWPSSWMMDPMWPNYWDMVRTHAHTHAPFMDVRYPWYINRGRTSNKQNDVDRQMCGLNEHKSWGLGKMNMKKIAMWRYVHTITCHLLTDLIRDFSQLLNHWKWQFVRPNKTIWNWWGPHNFQTFMLPYSYQS